MCNLHYYQIVLWLDDVRDPIKYRQSCSWRNNERVIWCHSVNEAINAWLNWDGCDEGRIVEIDLDHDAGDFMFDGGDYVKFLDWLEEHKIDFSQIIWKIHSMNPVGRDNIKRILEKNGVYYVYGLLA